MRQQYELILQYMKKASRRYAWSCDGQGNPLLARDPYTLNIKRFDGQPIEQIKRSSFFGPVPNSHSQGQLLRPLKIPCQSSFFSFAMRFTEHSQTLALTASVSQFPLHSIVMHPPIQVHAIVYHAASADQMELPFPIAKTTANADASARVLSFEKHLHD